ncbi:MAG: hypothetical protein IPQ09_08890 [Myxococcales bacterium]|nr:hypothetical protein [Myxococcales bacterium]
MAVAVARGTRFGYLVLQSGLPPPKKRDMSHASPGVSIGPKSAFASASVDALPTVSPRVNTM